MNISEDKLNSLLKLAGSKLGQDPQKLKSQLEAGQLDGLMSKLDPGTKEKVNGLMNNPKALEAMMQNDAVKKMLAGLAGNQK